MAISPKARGSALMQQNKNKPRNTYLGNGLYPGVTSRVVRQYGLLGGEVLTAQLS